MQLQDRNLTTVSNELNTTADAFDFDAWITLNGFDAIKPLFVRYGLNNEQNLNTLSKPFAALVSDPNLSGTPNAHLLPKVVTAIQKLSHITDTKNDKKSAQYLVISEKEESILQSLQSSMKELRDTEFRLKDLTKQLSQSGDSRQNRLEQIARTKHDIDAFFAAVQRILIAKRSSLLEEIASIEQQQCFGENNSEDRKEKEINAECNTLIAETHKMLSTAMSECQAVINPATAVSEREKQLIRVSNNASVQYVNAKRMLDDKLNIIESVAVDEPDGYSAVDVSFVHKANETRLVTLSTVIRSLSINSCSLGNSGEHSLPRPMDVCTVDMLLIRAKTREMIQSSLNFLKMYDIPSIPNPNVSASNDRINSTCTVDDQSNQADFDEKLDWKSYALIVLRPKRRAHDIDYSFLDEYAKSKQIEPAVFTTRSDIGYGPGWSVEMQFDGKRMGCTGWRKGTVADATRKCVIRFTMQVKRGDVDSIEMAHGMRWREVLLRGHTKNLKLYAQAHELTRPDFKTTQRNIGKNPRFTTVLNFLGKSVSYTAPTDLKSKNACVTRFVEEHMFSRVRV